MSFGVQSHGLMVEYTLGRQDHPQDVHLPRGRSLRTGGHWEQMAKHHIELRLLFLFWVFLLLLFLQQIDEFFLSPSILSGEIVTLLEKGTGTTCPPHWVLSELFLCRARQGLLRAPREHRLLAERRELLSRNKQP